MEILLEHGADVNATDSYGWTALLHRISGLLGEVSQHTTDWNPQVTQDEFVKLLLSKGATIDQKNIWFPGILERALTTSDEDFVNLMITKIGAIFFTKRILCVPSQMGNVRMVNFLISKGADVNNSPSNGWTALHCAASKNQVEIVRLLISKGANVNRSVGGRKEAPLHLAARYNHVDVANVLLSNGADINSIDEYGSTPLSIAVSKENENMVRLLITKGADLTLTDKGHTPESAARLKGAFHDFIFNSLRL